MDVPGLLTALDRYPYGCAEQTVEPRAAAASTPTPSPRSSASRRTRSSRSACRAPSSACSRCRTAPAPSASGVLEHGDLWLTGYVTDFLTRAKEQGFTVRPQAFNQALDRLQNFIAYARGLREGRRGPRLRALRAGPQRPRADRRAALLRRHAARPLLDAARQGPARRRAGHDRRQGRAPRRAFTAALDVVSAQADERRRLRARDYGSDLRDGAALRDARVRDRHRQRRSAEARRRRSPRPTLGRSYTSTQEQAWMLLAAHALAEQAKDSKLDRQRCAGRRRRRPRRCRRKRSSRRPLTDRQRRR